MADTSFMSERARNQEWVWRENQPVWLLWASLVPAQVWVLALGAYGIGGPPLPLPAAGLMCAVLLLALLLLGRLVTEVRSDRLVWHFGWLAWPCWQLRFEEIERVELTRNRALEGLGIRFTASGWLYNAHGLTALRLTLRNGRQLRLGTQQGRRLLQALEPRLQRPLQRPLQRR